MREKAIRLLLSLAVAVALGFGARQAFASPGPTGPGTGGSCSEGTCDYWCVTQAGANYGFCLNGTCVCRSGP
ncbi:hypothetical protein [Longimicrobium sp.]|uniref:hypothetical protein n=1 Tax=Longimicrobium sp. TaxID=2029185 RepID=UPI002E327126|nr:hypothetical protein [Longimicrobium sp.]HEX6039339.1 hypothetical protein [Longimicrobium sp.]